MSSMDILRGCQRFGDFTVDRADERLIGPDGPIKIGNKAFQVLAQLIDHQGKLLTKDALFSSVWDGTIVSESSLTSVIKELRRALGDDPREPRYIESVYGRGYRLIRSVEDSRAEPAPPASTAREPAGLMPSAGRPPLVLVAPFGDDSVRDHYPYCGSQLREEILSGLSRVREIQLVADDGNRSGNETRGYQLTATLLPDGGGVKVIARAKRLADGVVLWAETMPLGDGAEIAEGVEKIVRRIVGSALPALDEDLVLGLPPHPGDLYDAYLVAKRLSFTATTFEQACEARDALQRIIAERPDFGLAYPPLVRLYHTDFAWTALGSTGPDERAEALRLAKCGLAADRSNAHAHSVLGWCYLWHNERALARRSFEQALALNPYNRVRVEEAATAWGYLGDFDGADKLLARVAELDPFPDDDLCEDAGRLKLVRGDYEGARQCLLQIVGGTIWADLYLGACETALGLSSGKERVGRWIQRVESAWHGGRRPDRGDLRAWVRRHHPWPAEAEAAFFAPIEQALAA